MPCDWVWVLGLGVGFSFGCVLGLSGVGFGLCFVGFVCWFGLGRVLGGFWVCEFVVLWVLVVFKVGFCFGCGLWDFRFVVVVWVGFWVGFGLWGFVARWLFYFGVCWFGCVLVMFVGLGLNLWLRKLLLFGWCGWGV